ncbi:C-type lectin 37Da-like [Zeugodacus cucurbitae]|nr:C-type lectin 37Da-like [Zeugodacus cucurbitae]
MDLVRYIAFILLFMSNLSYNASSTTVQEENDMDMHPFVKVGNKYYLVFHDFDLDWFGAAHFCRSYDSDLLTIESKAERDALLEHLKSMFSLVRAWTSGNDLSEEGKYMSFNTGRPMIYKFWAPNEPNNAGDKEDCVQAVLYSGGFHLNDIDCSKKFRVICEKKRPPSNIARNAATSDEKSQCERVTTNCALKKLVDGYLQASSIFNCTQTNGRR